MNTITLPAELARDLARGLVPEGCEYEIFADLSVDEKRWVVTHELIIKEPDGRLWVGTYRKGTDDTGEQPWECETEVEFIEIYPRAAVTAPKVVQTAQQILPGYDFEDAARRVVLSQTENIDYGGVGEHLGPEWLDIRELTDEQWDIVHNEIHNLALSATVTVTWEK